MADSAILPTHTLRVDRPGYPYLSGHTVSDLPVLPMVLAAEWFIAFARRLVPEQTLFSCRNLRVFRGVELDAYDRGGNKLMLRLLRHADSAADGLELLLSDADGRPRYGANVLPGASRVLGPSLSRAASAPWPFSPERAYQDHLFHTGSFRVLRRLGTCDAEGADAEALGGARAGFPLGRWQTDPALLDAGLQLALLWVRARLGKQSLPTSIGRLVIHRPGLHLGSAHISLRARPQGATCVAFDLSIRDEAGVPLASMEDAEVHLLAEDRWGPHAGQVSGRGRLLSAATPRDGTP